MIDADIKLKHLEKLLLKKGTSPFDLLGIKDNFFNRFRFRDTFFVMRYNLIEFLNTDPRTIEYELGELILPSSFENISFKNMVSLKMLSSDLPINETIIETIILVCVEENGNDEKSFRNVVENLSFNYAMGLFNKITKDLNKSSRDWEKKFMYVEVIDRDWDEAGGGDLKIFDTIKTIKTTCQDFNVTYEESWKMPYSVIQTNNYEKAYSNFVQDKLRQIKERKMKQSRK